MMNSVVRVQAMALPQFDMALEDTRVHLFLEKMRLPLDVQDQIIKAVADNRRCNLDAMGEFIEQAMNSRLPDFLTH